MVLPVDFAGFAFDGPVAIFRLASFFGATLFAVDFFGATFFFAAGFAAVFFPAFERACVAAFLPFAFALGLAMVARPPDFPRLLIGRRVDSGQPVSAIAPA